MKRSMSRLGVVFGSAALLALSAGCSKEHKQGAQQPSPSFESQVGTSSGYEQQYGTQGQSTTTPGASDSTMHGGSMQGTQQGGSMQGGSMQGDQSGMQGGSMQGDQSGMQGGSMQGSQQGGSYGQQGMQGGSQSGMQGGSQSGSMSGAQGMGTGVETGATLDESALCSELGQEARVRLEEVQGGLAIVVTPKQGNTLATVRDTARRIERGIQQSGSQGTSQGASCDLFSLGRTSGVNTSIIEGQDQLRIQMTTSDQSQVKTLRQQGRDFVTKLNKSGAGSQSGSQGGSKGSSSGSQGGSQKGSSGSQGGSQSGSQGGSKGSSGSQGGTQGGSQY